jgi:hemin uptake protein HemP
VPSPARPTVPAEPKNPPVEPATVDSTSLMAGRREVLIRHGDSTYRLRITSTNKLILTK